MTRLSVLLAVSCLGTAGALLAGRALLDRRDPLTPERSSAALERVWRWSPDPRRRQEAALLLASRDPGDGTAAGQGAWLTAQGWGTHPLAAVVLKQAALRREARGEKAAALPLWRQLWRRFPQEPASADALYALGRQTPSWREELRRRFPAHPAALAAALEAGPGEKERERGALHLAPWGPRWPGAGDAIAAVCAQPAVGPSSRALLTQGLAEAGDGAGALRCLGEKGPDPAALGALSDRGRLAVARAWGKGPPDAQRLVAPLLAAMARERPEAPEAEDAVRLLSEREGADVPALLATLPPRWRASAPVRARLAQNDTAGTAILEVLRRWPRDPASWDLQWEATRKAFLAGNWQAALTLLEALPPDQLPPALAARHRFWLGYVQRQLGLQDEATLTWKELLLRHPGGYYGWRASARLGQEDLRVDQEPGGPLTVDPPGRWHPLASGDPALDGLWRLGQATEAWETWRVRRGGEAPSDSADLLVEGRLRQAVGDDWTALGQLERAALRLRPEQCALLPELERSLHPSRFLEAIAPAAARHRLAPSLLLGVAKQESRFTPGVQSSAAAVGLLQLMPATAAELAGSPLSTSDLQDPKRNAELGAQYLRGLLKQWNGEPLAAVASYNAGAGAVGGWTSVDRTRVPELWVEAIPYPETRLYVKKVLGNAWSYQRARQPAC
ncbi:MAG: transglycosylase SLT domain-containing protein [Cyanobacteriota bacterium]